MAKNEIEIVDFQEEYFDELIHVLRDTFKLLGRGLPYSKKEKGLVEEIVLDEFLNPLVNTGKIVRAYGMISAGAVLKGDSIFPVYHLSQVGEESVRELVRHMENLLLDFGNNELNIYGLKDRYKNYIIPFRYEDYVFHADDIDYPLNASSNENSIQVIRMRKSMNLV